MLVNSCHPHDNDNAAEGECILFLDTLILVDGIMRRHDRRDETSCALISTITVAKEKCGKPIQVQSVRHVTACRELLIESGLANKYYQTRIMWTVITSGIKEKSNNDQQLPSAKLQQNQLTTSTQQFRGV